MPETAKIEGLMELDKALNELEGEVASSICSRGTAKSAQVIHKNLRRRKPVETGELKKAIIYTAEACFLLSAYLESTRQVEYV